MIIIKPTVLQIELYDACLDQDTVEKLPQSLIVPLGYPVPREGENIVLPDRDNPEACHRWKILAVNHHLNYFTPASENTNGHDVFNIRLLVRRSDDV